MACLLVLSPWIKLLLSMGSGIFELVGVLFMSRRYVNVDVSQALQALASALWRGKTAQKVAKIEALSRDDVMRSLQGLSLIGIGFLFSTACNVLSAF